MSPREKKRHLGLCIRMPQGMGGAPSFMNHTVTELYAITGVIAKRG